MAKSLMYYLAEMRRLENRRTKEAQSELRELYREAYRELSAFISDYYVEYAEDGKLDYNILRGKGELARFLEEAQAQAGSLGVKQSALTDRVVSEVYGMTYSGAVEAVHKAVTREAARAVLEPLRLTQADAIRRMINNPVSKLTLPDTLAAQRAQIVRGIKQSISNGLANGDRYTDMAKRVRGSLGGDYNKAITTVRTETHRVREGARQEAMEDIDRQLKDGGRASGLAMVKTWRTMQDESVRPQRGISKKTGKKLASSRGGKADHVKMNGVTIPVYEKFDLGNGVTADAPGNSGDAANDINCRCILLYDMQDMGGNSMVGNKARDTPPITLTEDMQKAYDDAIRQEPKITQDVTQAVKDAGAETAGLDFRIKAPESYARKVHSDMQKKGLAEKDVIQSIYDTVRYTALAPPEKLADSYHRIVENLNGKGYNTVRVKNTWLNPNSPYKGINTVLQAPNGQKFEVQYHTPESFKLKNGELHQLYEKARVLETTSLEFIRLQEKMLALSAVLKIPLDIGGIK